MGGDYISREAALKAIYTSTAPALEVKAMPAADVAPVRHGKWERTEGNPYPSCSECGCESLSRADRPYCQFCGAKMDGKSADYAPAKPYDLLYEEGGPDA